MAMPEYMLMIANSGRMLAEAAAKAGLRALVVDLYADKDTRRYAADCFKIPTMSEAHIKLALDFFFEKYSVKHAIYGSGFENHPESLDYLNERLIILGNSPETFSRIHDKVRFFSLLNELKIDFPDVAFAAPDDGENWLMKPVRGEGGLGIRRHHPEYCAGASHYWQKFQAGSTHSVLFLADGQQARVIGFNTQWTTSLSDSEEFIFAGIINDADIDVAQKSRLADWIDRCLKVFPLRGLNSLDFIKSGERCLVLEINARPPASMQLYDDLLIGHIGAARGVLPDSLPETRGYTGYQIVYAGEDTMIADRFVWPEGCRDIPETGVICRKGQPVCSIIAHQNSSQQVLDQLKHTQQIVNHIIKVQPHGI